MIKKYIEFEKVKNAIMGQPPDAHYPSWYMSLIEQLPYVNTIQPERKKGRIVTETKFGFRIYRCSECKTALMQISVTNFCPYCGAEMAGE